MVGPCFNTVIVSVQRKWKNIHNNSLFPLKFKGNENQIAWDCCSDRWVGNRFFVVVGGKCRRSNRSTRQPQCLPVCRWTGCPHCAPEGNLSWQCVRLQVEPGKSGTSASCCWRKERESTSERAGCWTSFSCFFIWGMSVLSQFRPLMASNFDHWYEIKHRFPVSIRTPWTHLCHWHKIDPIRLCSSVCRAF